MSRCRTLLVVAALPALLATSACGSGNDDGVGGVTATEARALNDAAEMLDGRPRGELKVSNTTAPPPPDGSAVKAAPSDKLQP
ncbi:hypothetical protein PX699_02955 [Sphingobium sp. H39-3-25]|uniref:hypothetical protein n=1 Tax=Sphingobium arseniciresistens TaxID=3030834 RepID=UPI0023B98109|nr:hypothetical protein [Sphingobium arseniciresistens]